jgi:Transposase domain (DUF772)
VLADEDIVAAVYEALAKRHPKSRCRGRRGAPAEMVLRLLVLKHIRNWSYEVLEREVRANLVYRDFTRVGGGKMPDAKTMGRWAWRSSPRCSSRFIISDAGPCLPSVWLLAEGDGRGWLAGAGCRGHVLATPRRRRFSHCWPLSVQLSRDNEFGVGWGNRGFRPSYRRRGPHVPLLES